MDYGWKVHEDLCESDHFPIILKFLQPLRDDRLPHRIINKANWQIFEAIYKQKLLKDPNIIVKCNNASGKLLIRQTQTVSESLKAKRDAYISVNWEKCIETLSSNLKIYKLLGVVFERILTFIPHIRYLKSKFTLDNCEWLPTQNGKMTVERSLNYTNHWSAQN